MARGARRRCRIAFLCFESDRVVEQSSLSSQAVRAFREASAGIRQRIGTCKNNSHHLTIRNVSTIINFENKGYRCHNSFENPR